MKCCHCIPIKIGAILIGITGILIYALELSISVPYMHNYDPHAHYIPDDKIHLISNSSTEEHMHHIIENRHQPRHLQQFNPLQTLCENFELFLWRILEIEAEKLDDEKVTDFILTYQDRYIWSCCLTLIIEESIYAFRWFSEQLIDKYFGNKCFSESYKFYKISKLFFLWTIWNLDAFSGVNNQSFGNPSKVVFYFLLEFVMIENY